MDPPGCFPSDGVFGGGARQTADDFDLGRLAARDRSSQRSEARVDGMGWDGQVAFVWMYSVSRQDLNVPYIRVLSYLPVSLCTSDNQHQEGAKSRAYLERNGVGQIQIRAQSKSDVGDCRLGLCRDGSFVVE